MYNPGERLDIFTLSALLRIMRESFLILAVFAVVFFLPVNNQTFAQSDIAEIEFWQSVKNSTEPLELKAYLDLYPQGKFAPLARLRMKKLTPPPVEPVKPVEPVQPVNPNPPPVVPVEPLRPIPLDPLLIPLDTPPTPLDPLLIPQDPPPTPLDPLLIPQDPLLIPQDPPPTPLPVFKPDAASVTNETCQQRLGPNGIAEADFSGAGAICLCQPPFEITADGQACILSPRANVPPPESRPQEPIERPRPVIRRKKPRPNIRRKPKPVIVKRRSKKRPPKAQGRRIANSYCRRRYGARLKSVVVKKSKFYCHYQLQLGNNSSIGVKKKKFKNIR